MSLSPLRPALALCLLATLVAAEDRAFLFSVAPTRGDAPASAFAFTESSLGDPGSSRLVGDGLEQRLGFQARFGRRFTVLASALVPVGEETRGGTTARAELLYDLVSAAPPLKASLAAGGGVQREPGGVNVLVGRGVIDFTRARFRTTANMLVEKPLSEGRDRLDALTSLGFALRFGPRFDAGVEMLAEDLEALWEANEAEGGARMMIGPSLHYRSGGRIEANLAGGPIFLLRSAMGSSDALRALGNQAGKDRGYVVRASVAYRF